MGEYTPAALVINIVRETGVTWHQGLAESAGACHAIRLRPCCLAQYSAWSALPMRDSTVSPGAARAIPTLHRRGMPLLGDTARSLTSLFHRFPAVEVGKDAKVAFP